MMSISALNKPGGELRRYSSYRYSEKILIQNLDPPSPIIVPAKSLDLPDTTVNLAGRADPLQCFPAPRIASAISWLSWASVRLCAATKAA